MKKIIRVVFELILILGIMLLSGQVIQKNKELKKVDSKHQQLESTIENLKNTNLDYENSIIELRKSISQYQSDYFSEADLYMLGAKTTEEAKQKLWESIQNQEAKIPSHPVLGGKFFFAKGAPLKQNWYLAEVEDGHIKGVLIFKYDVLANDKISWKLIDYQFD